MAKLPTALSLPILCGAVKRAVSYSKHFKYSKQRQNFIYLVCSILLNNSALLQSVQSITLVAKSWSVCLSRFLISSAWNTKILNNILLSLFRKHASEIKYLALDWTSLVKTGKHFEWLCPVHDGRDGKIKNGFPLLLALGVSEGKNLKFPLADILASWDKPEFKSENTIILKFLQIVKNQLLQIDNTLWTNIILLLDRGFYRTLIIKALLRLKLPFIIHAKSNINISLTDKENSGKTETKLSSLPQGYYEKVHIKHLRRQLTVAVYWERDKEDKQWKKVIVVSNLKGQNQELLQTSYSHRWAIEEYFKELKSKYDLENFRVRKFMAIERLIKLIMITQALFTGSLISNNDWQRLLKDILAEFLNYKVKIHKKGIGLLREISFRLCYFGLINNFRLALYLLVI